MRQSIDCRIVIGQGGRQLEAEPLLELGRELHSLKGAKAIACKRFPCVDFVGADAKRAGDPLGQPSHDCVNRG